MISPLFHILERNLGVPDADRGDSVTQLSHRKGGRIEGTRKTSQRFIDGYFIANKLTESGMSRWGAVKLVGRKYNIGAANLYGNWNRIEAAAKAQIKQGEDHGE